MLSDGRLLDVFCKDLSTDNPKEYITLQHTEENNNFSSYDGGRPDLGPGVRTYYTKLRLNPVTLAVSTNDYLYASYDAAQYINHEIKWYQIPYGVARDCNGYGSTAGLANINLLGTVFSVVTNQFYPKGNGTGTSNYTSANQIVDITGGGGCGWNAPGNFNDNYMGGLLQLNLLSSPVFVTSITTHIADGIYGQGQAIPIIISFSDAVNVTGTPKLALNTGSSINYSSGSGTNTLIFNYIVAPGDNIADLNYDSVAALTLNSGTIHDLSSNSVSLALPATNSPVSLGGAKEIVISSPAPDPDLTPPIAPTLSATPATATSGNVTVTITYSNDTIQRKYQIGNGSIMDYTQPITLSANQTILAYGFDEAGNKSPEILYISPEFDINHDGIIDISDVILLIIQEIDVTGDMQFDNNDINFILDAIQSQITI